MSVIAAAIQITSTSSKEENYQKAADRVRQAVDRQARFIVLPEHWNWLGPDKEKKANAESIQGDSIQFIQRLAKQYQCWFIAGSIAERNRKRPSYNTSVVIDPDGRLGKAYRKIHLFDAQIARGYKESNSTSSGKEIIIEDLSWGKLGLAICYDIRFPELFLQMVSKGATVFAVPSNFTAITGPPHWEILVRARAIENQCFVIAADQTGMTGAGFEAHGHSMIVDPWGEILALAGKEEGVIVAELNLGKLKEIRKKMPVHSHRKLF